MQDILLDFLLKLRVCVFYHVCAQVGVLQRVGRIEQHSQTVSDIRIGKKLDLNILFLIITDRNLRKPLTDTDLCQLVLQREAVIRQR